MFRSCEINVASPQWTKLNGNECVCVSVCAYMRAQRHTHTRSPTTSLKIDPNSYRTNEIAHEHTQRSADVATPTNGAAAAPRDSLLLAPRMRAARRNRTNCDGNGDGDACGRDLTRATHLSRSRASQPASKQPIDGKSAHAKSRAHPLAAPPLRQIFIKLCMRDRSQG